MYKETIKKFIKYLCEAEKKYNTDIYLVGGFLRDHYLKKESYDLDFIVSCNAKDTAMWFRNKTKGVFIILDEDEKTYRVVVRMQDSKLSSDNSSGILDQTISLWFDFSEMREGSLDKDLNQRDFTINTNKCQ